MLFASLMVGCLCTQQAGDHTAAFNACLEMCQMSFWALTLTSGFILMFATILLTNDYLTFSQYGWLVVGVMHCSTPCLDSQNC